MTRLAIDSRDIFAAQPRGTGKATETLLQHMLPLLQKWEVSLYTNRSGGVDFPAPMQVRHIDLRGDRFDAWERIRLPWAAFVDRVDLLHCPSQTAPPITFCPVVLTVHDLIPLKIGDGWSPREVSRFRHVLTRSVRRARRIIAVSEFTRKDLMFEFQVPEDKIDVVWWGAKTEVPAPLSEEEWSSACRVYGLRSPFFVAFGGEAPRKNVKRLLEALMRFIRDRSPDVQLVLLGISSRVAERFNSLIDHLGISKHVIMLGYVSDDAISQLLMRSEALVYVSLYEGFGLPILEAMAVGAPVITSNVTSMPEVAGEAAFFVDPTNPGEISEAMRECYLNDSVKSSLRTQGYSRVKCFSWDRAAEQTFSVYLRALGEVSSVRLS